MQDERRVDLVDQERDLGTLACVGDHLQVGARPDIAGRVVRAAEQVDGGVRPGQRRLDRVRVQPVPAGRVAGQRGVDDVPPVEAEPEPERRGEGGGGDDGPPRGGGGRPPPREPPPHLPERDKTGGGRAPPPTPPGETPAPPPPPPP